MTINVPLLRETLAHIEAHPEEWDQTQWWCGTVGCFAGHAVNLSGATWVTAADGFACVAPDGDDDPDNVWEDGLIAVSRRARRLLGLTDREKLRLFQGGNTLEDLRRIVGELIEQAEAEESRC